MHKHYPPTTNGTIKLNNENTTTDRCEAGVSCYCTITVICTVHTLHNYNCTVHNRMHSIPLSQHSVPELEQQEPGIHGELVDVRVYTVRAQYLLYLHALITRRECVYTCMMCLYYTHRYITLYICDYTILININIIYGDGIIFYHRRPRYDYNI